MKKVIIRTRHQDLTLPMLAFGNRCVANFIHHLEQKTYGEDWKDCAYSNDEKGLSGWVTLSKSGTISALVISKTISPGSD